MRRQHNNASNKTAPNKTKTKGKKTKRTKHRQAQPANQPKNKRMKTKTQNRTNTNQTIGNKRQFLEAVHLLAPGNKFIHAAARHVPQEILPAIAGVAALEFASTLDLLCKSWRLRRPLEAGRMAGRRSCRSRN